jgi:hypothetical protein
MQFTRGGYGLAQTTRPDIGTVASRASGTPTRTTPSAESATTTASTQKTGT